MAIRVADFCARLKRDRTKRLCGLIRMHPIKTTWVRDGAESMTLPNLFAVVSN
jgi:hypothetical protein